MAAPTLDIFPNEIHFRILGFVGLDWASAKLVCRTWRDIIVIFRDALQEKVLAKMLSSKYPDIVFADNLRHPIPCRGIMRMLFDKGRFARHIGFDAESKSPVRTLTASANNPIKLSALLDVVVEFAASHGLDKYRDMTDPTGGLNAAFAFDLLASIRLSIFACPALRQIADSIMGMSTSGDHDLFVCLLKNLYYEDNYYRGTPEYRSDLDDDDNVQAELAIMTARDVIIIIYAIITPGQPMPDVTIGGENYSSLVNYVHNMQWSFSRDWVMKRWKIDRN